jgi:hypothetical protein
MCGVHMVLSQGWIDVLLWFNFKNKRLYGMAFGHGSRPLVTILSCNNEVLGLNLTISKVQGSSYMVGVSKKNVS